MSEWYSPVFGNCNYYGGISIASEKKICITDSNYPVRGNVPCISASYGTDYLYCAGKAWNKKSVLCILGCILILIFVNRFTDGMNDALSNTQYSNMVTDWKEWEDNGTNPIRVFVYSIPMIFLWLDAGRSKKRITR